MIRKNVLLAGISYGLKFCANVVLLLALARVFGPEKFGVFSFAMTVAVFLGVIVDYGFNLQVVHKVSQSPNRVQKEVQEMLAAKSILIILALGGCVVSFLTSSVETAALILILTISIILFSFGQFFFSVLRAFNRFSEETHSTIISNILLFIPLILLLFFNSNIYLIALVFLLSRLTFFLLGAKICFDDYATFNRKYLGVTEFSRVLKKGFPYAILMASSLLFLSVDTFIVNHVLGSEAVGIYQSGVRFVFAALVISETLMSVYLPVLAGCVLKDSENFERRAKQLIRASIVISLPIGLVLVLLPQQITSLTLGEAYSRTAELLPYFGFIIMLRFLTISYGTLLTAMGLQNRRTVAILLSLVIFAIGAYALIFRNGLIGVVTASLIAHVVLLGLYCWDIYASRKQLYLEQKAVYMLLLSILAFVFAFWLSPGVVIGLAIILLVAVVSLPVGLTKLELKALLRTDWLFRKKRTVLEK